MTVAAPVRFGLIPDVSTILVRDDHLLLIKRVNCGYMDGRYCLPGGHMEAGESAAEGAIRETFEEVGLRIDPAALACVHVIDKLDHGTARVSFLYVADRWEGELINPEPHKHEDPAWHPLNQLPDMIPWQHQAVECWQRGIPFSEYRVG